MEQQSFTGQLRVRTRLPKYQTAKIKLIKVARRRSDLSFLTLFTFNTKRMSSLDHYDPLQVAMLEEEVILVDGNDNILGKASKKISMRKHLAFFPFIVLIFD
jgi:hypothetical protein